MVRLDFIGLGLWRNRAIRPSIECPASLSHNFRKAFGFTPAKSVNNVVYVPRELYPISKQIAVTDRGVSSNNRFASCIQRAVRKRAGLTEVVPSKTRRKWWELMKAMAAIACRLGGIRGSLRIKSITCLNAWRRPSKVAGRWITEPSRPTTIENLVSCQ
jgi:hypothetical protein